MNIKVAATKSITFAFMAGAATVSFSHIVSVSETLGLTWEAYTVPFMIDGIAILGLIGRSSGFAQGTRKAGLALVMGAGLLSLVCNVMAGDNLGRQLYGALTVIVFMASEWYAKKITAAPAPAPVVDPKRSAAARKAAVTRAARKAEASKPVRTPRAPRKASVKALEAAYALPSAPVSPAP